MANQKITVVYQDCPMCGDRGKTLKKIVAAKGIRLHKVSFASDEGNSLIRVALFEKGIKTMPFFTDGKNFSTDINDLLTVKKKAKAKK